MMRDDEKREAMLAAAKQQWMCEKNMYFLKDRAPESMVSFALAQMQPLEARIAELERRLAVAVDALEWIEAYDNYTLSLSAPSKKASEALDQIRGGAAAEVKGEINKT